MSSELVTLTAKFPEGGEVTQTLVPDRPLPEVVFVLKKPVSNQTPPKKITTKPNLPKTPTPPSSQNREGTIDPFKP
jgi:hypothetical protein